MPHVGQYFIESTHVHHSVYVDNLRAAASSTNADASFFFLPERAADLANLAMKWFLKKCQPSFRSSLLLTITHYYHFHLNNIFQGFRFSGNHPFVNFASKWKPTLTYNKPTRSSSTELASSHNLTRWKKKRSLFGPYVLKLISLLILWPGLFSKH